jgi:molybdopterin-containing oxidoreductase family membrane subunit
MVVTLLVPARELFGLKKLITIQHLDIMCKVILATSCMVGYAYGIEFFSAWYSGNEFEQFTFINRAFGPYAWAYWSMVTCNVMIPHVFWFRVIRTSPWLMMPFVLLVNVGMWFERFVIIATSLHRDFVPSSWSYFIPTYVDILTFVGSFGLFMTLFLLFCRFLPMVAMSEVKLTLLHEAEHGKPPDYSTTLAANGSSPHVQPAIQGVIR